MVLYLVAPILVTVAVILTVHPSKNDPHYPLRKRRDWWVIGGLFGGGIVAYYVFKTSVKVALQVVPPLRPIGAILEVEIPRPLRRLLALGFAAVLAWQVVEEVALRPQRERQARPQRATAPTVDRLQASADLPGASDVTVTFEKGTVVARNVVGAPASGQPWPAGVRYNPANPADAVAAGEPVIYWDEAVILAGLCAAALGLWHMDQNRDDVYDDDE